MKESVSVNKVKLFPAVPADTLPMGDSQGGERILPLENKPKLCLGAVSNHRKEFPAGTPGLFQWVSRGFSLLELLVTLSLLMVLLLMSIPMAGTFFSQIKLNHETERLFRILENARLWAVLKDSPLILCPSKQGKACDATWERNLLLRDSKELLEFYSMKDPHVSILYRGFPDSTKIIITPFGFSNQSNGTFFIKYRWGVFHFEKHLILNRGGRIRIGE